MKKAILSAVFCLTLIAANAGQFFGKYEYKAIAMNEGDCMYIRHYYQSRFFGFSMGTGYWDENISGGCGGHQPE